MKDDTDLSLEVVILLILGIFMLVFGFLLFKIHAGKLSYNPDSTYGLFLVIVSFQVITMGKTPFGDLRRSWVLITIGICTAMFGMFACFVPGYVTGFARIFVGIVLFAGGLTLFVQLFAAKKKARTWMTLGGMLQQLTIACALTYVLTVFTGAITLFRGTTTDVQTAVLLIAYGLSFFYLSWCIWKVGRLYAPASVTANSEDAASQSRPYIFREVSLPLSLAILIILGILLTVLGLLLFPVNLGVIAFSPDGQLGLLLTVTSIQMMSLGETPLGQFKRSWLMIMIGLLFAALGVVSSIVPGLLTGVIQILLGFLNLAGGALSLIQRWLPMLREVSTRGGAPRIVPPNVRKLVAIQTTLNWVQIAFGASMLVPSIVPGLLIAGILVINGLLLFILASALPKMTAVT
jgi:uncharacterized membrane protein HdeD (DUF308 family)